jgi:AhpC/TSA family
MKSERFFALASSLLLASGLFCACSRPAAFDPASDPMVGKPAPAFVFHNAHHRAFPSSNFNGKVRVFIFARPAQLELPALLTEMDRLHQDPGFTSVQFMVILPEEDPLVESFWNGLRIHLPFALDYTGVAARYGAGSLPLVVIVDHRGIVRLRADGYLGAQFRPRLATTHRILAEVARLRSRPSAPVR